MFNNEQKEVEHLHTEDKIWYFHSYVQSVDLPEYANTWTQKQRVTCEVLLALVNSASRLAQAKDNLKPILKGSEIPWKYTTWIHALIQNRDAFEFKFNANQSLVRATFRHKVS